MNKLYKYLLLFLLPLLFFACAGDKVREEVSITGKPMTVQFFLENQLRASGNENIIHSSPALEREKKVEKLFAIVYNTASGIHYKTIECTKNTTSDTYEFDNEKSGNFYFYLVANPDEELERALKAGPTTPENLGILIAKQTPGEDKNADKFLMTSGKNNVTVASKTSTTLPDAIKLTRVAARFDFYNKIEGLSIDKIIFNKRYTQSHLFAQVGKMEGLESTDNKEYAGDLFENGVLKATIYGYETDTRGETSFTLEASYKGKKLTPQTIKLENFLIKRNHLYNIILHELGGAVKPNPDPNQKFGEVKYDIEVVDWNGEETLSMDEEMVLKPLFVSYDVELSNASYMNPYLKDSQKDIYTLTKKATSLIFKVNSYIRQGSLDFKEGFDKSGYTLSEVSTSVKDPSTGKITRTYKLELPAIEEYVAINKFNAENKLEGFQFTDIPLVAKNFSGETKKSFTIHHGRIKMPIEYLSETPLNKAGDGFPTEGNKVSSIGYFSQKYEAIPKFKTCQINEQGYHLPRDLYELASLIPNGGKGGIPAIGTQGVEANNQLEWIVFPCWLKAGVNKKNFISVFASDYRTNSSKTISYGLRFKAESRLGFGKKLLIAYRFEWVGEFNHVTEKDDIVPSYFQITCRYLGENFNGSVEDITNEEFWNKNNQEDISRKLYALGEIDNFYTIGDSSRSMEMGKETYIISTQMDKSNSYAYCANLTKNGWLSNSSRLANRTKTEDSESFPIWLFSDK